MNNLFRFSFACPVTFACELLLPAPVAPSDGRAVTFSPPCRGPSLAARTRAGEPPPRRHVSPAATPPAPTRPPPPSSGRSLAASEPSRRPRATPLTLRPDTPPSYRTSPTRPTCTTRRRRCTRRRPRTTAITPSTARSHRTLRLTTTTTTTTPLPTHSTTSIRPTPTDTRTRSTATTASIPITPPTLSTTTGSKWVRRPAGPNPNTVASAP